MNKSLSVLFSLGCCTLSNLWFSNSALAQISVDGTTNTTVNNDNNGNFTIEQGDRAGNNLFHSFGDFSVPTNGSAFFNNATDISNIFSRVTGGNISNIDGLLGANGSANLFLVNPAGILFGNNARLDIGGSFLGTTADSILFEDGVFSATDLDNPPLLTINAPIGLNFRDNPNEIVNSSFVENDAGEFVGLEVEQGNNLSLLGGDISFDSGEVTARGGRVELGGLSDAGTITIEPNGSLTFPQGVARSNVSFSNLADVDVRSEGGGSISVNANNIEFLGGEFGGSQLGAGILSSSTSPDAQAGDINLNATGAINISQGSGIFNQVDADGIGNSGNIIINTTGLSLLDGSQIAAGVFGTGNAGDIILDIINTTELTTGNIFSQVGSTGVGEGGNITLNTTNLSLLDGSQITAGVFGTGNAGRVTVNALGDITFQGIDSDGFPSGIISNVASEGSGNAGDIEVNTANLSLIDGGIIASDIFGEGNAGSIEINASDAVNISGTTVVDENLTRFSRVNSSTDTDVVGDAGSIEIDANSLTISDGGVLETSTDGQGNAGNITLNIDGAVNLTNNADIFSRVNSNAITEEGTKSTVTINADSLSIGDAASSISTTTLGQGNAGNITLDITNTTELTTGSISSQLGATGVGEGGNITLNTTNLSLLDGAQITAGVFGTGNAGTVTVNALGDITFQGIDSDGFPSGIISNVASEGSGNAGDIEVNTANLSLIDGGIIASDIFGEGNAGSIEINASGAVNISGTTVVDENTTRASQVSSRTFAEVEGNAGRIEISANSLSLSDGGVLETSTDGQGNAGNITLNIEGAVNLTNNADIFSNVESNATTEEGTRSTVTINADSLSIGDAASSISTTTFGQGNAGNITLDITNTTELTTGDIFSQVEEMGNGEGGNITLTTSNLSLLDGAQITAGVFGTGDAGDVTINASGDIIFQGIDNAGLPSGILSNVESGGTGNAGNTVVTTANLNLIDGGRITSNVRGAGNAGSVTINASDAVNVSGFTVFDENTTRFSQVSSRTFADVVGDAGSIEIDANSLTISDGGRITSSTDGQGNAGNITLNIDGAVNITNNADIFSDVDSNAITEEGTRSTVTINADSLSIADGASSISATTFGQGNAGNITLDITNTTELITGNIFSQVGGTGVGEGGNITLNTSNLSLIDGAQITAAVFGTGDAGSVTVNASNTITFQGVDPDSGFATGITNNVASDVTGDAGDITITTANLSLIDGGRITSDVFGEGNAGSIKINAGDAVNISGSTVVNENTTRFSRVSSQTGTDVVGDAGSIEIDANSLTISDGGRITSSTDGQGNAGNITLNIDGAVTLTNNGDIFSEVESNAITDEGARSTVTINAGSLSIADGASSISTTTLGQGNAGNINLDITNATELITGDIFSQVEEMGNGEGGNITLTTSNLSLLDGAQITAGVFGTGDAGDVTINASGNANFQGIDNDGFPSGIINNVAGSGTGNAGDTVVTTANLNLINGGTIASDVFGEGNAGSITINASDAVNISGSTVFNEDITRVSQVGSSNFGQGTGGIVKIQADDLTLDNQAGIFAVTTFEPPEDTSPSEINLFIDDTVTLKGNSTISAEAANSADGGNITIDANGFVIAFPSEGIGNDIRANADGEGSGGEINISAQEIFGLSEARGTSGLENNSNDIDASSEDGNSDGEVTLNTPDTNSIQETIEIPTNIIEPNQNVAQACANRRDRGLASNFVIKGRGGVPQSPVAPLGSEVITVNGEVANNSNNSYAIPTSYGYITPARGIMKTAEGKIILTATPVSGNASRMAHGSLNCG